MAVRARRLTGHGRLAAPIPIRTPDAFGDRHVVEVVQRPVGGHGGFVAAWAVGQADRFEVGPMGAGISDW